MVDINFNFQKKDLWLFSAIAIFLIGVGCVVAYNTAWETIPGDPAVHGHTPDEIMGGGGTEVYDSGWFAVTAGQDYTLNHTLNSANVMYQLFFSRFANGSDAAEIGWYVDHSHGDFHYEIGGQVTEITENSVVVRTGSNYVGYINREFSGYYAGSYSSGYYRLLAIKV